MYNKWILLFLATACSSTNLGSNLTKTGSTAWTQYAFIYTAGNPSPILSFGFRASGASGNYLDAVSVVDISTPSVELLQNPSFENSLSSPIGWVQWCQSSCTGGTSDQDIVNSSSCKSGAGNFCYRDRCQGGIDFLGQSFTTVINRTYNISFWLFQWGGNSAKFYFDIFWSVIVWDSTYDIIINISEIQNESLQVLSLIIKLNEIMLREKTKFENIRLLLIQLMRNLSIYCDRRMSTWAFLKFRFLITTQQ